MSDEKRTIPTGPGWWWRGGLSEPFATKVYGVRGRLRYSVAGYGDDVTDDGRWIAPVLTHAEADALRERAKRAEASDLECAGYLDEALTRAMTAEAERDRYREAVGRLRTEVLRALNFAGGATGPLDGDDLRDVLAATTDEAIQGYDEPPEPLGGAGRSPNED